MQYELLEDEPLLSKLYGSLTADKAIDLPSVAMRDIQNNWVVPENPTETEAGISIGLPLLEAIPGDILVCLRVPSGRYQTKSETAKKWLICTQNEYLPHKFWVKY